MYTELGIDFEITPQLQNAINDLLNHVNNEDGSSEDMYRCEISFWLKDAFDRSVVDRSQYELLNDYYVHKGIYRRGKSHV